MNLEIRIAKRDDAEIIRKFIVDLARYQKQANSVEVNVEMIESQLDSDRPPFECLIAEVDGNPAGFALFYDNYSTWEGRPGIYLEDLYVDPRARLNGIGRKLLLSLCQLALERGATRLDWSVHATNFQAINFYSVIGAEPMPEWIKWRLDEAGMQNLLDIEKGVLKFPERKSEPLDQSVSLSLIKQEDSSKLARIY